MQTKVDQTKGIQSKLFPTELLQVIKKIWFTKKNSFQNTKQRLVRQFICSLTQKHKSNTNILQETPTLLACADSRIDYMESRLFDTFLLLHFLALFICIFDTFLTFLTLFVNHVTCEVAHVTNANSHRPPPGDSPIIHIRLPSHKKNT